MSMMAQRLRRTQNPHQSRYWSMGYFAGWDATLPVQDIDWSGLTHAMVFAVLPTASGELDTTFSHGTPASGDAWVDSLVSAAHTANRQAFLTIGGGGTYDAFSAALSTANSRSSLATATGNYLRAHHFDGFDIDYEPLTDADVPNLLLFIDAFTAQLPAMPITMCNGVLNTNNRSSMLSNANLLALSQRLVMFNSMTYGMAGDWPGWQSWHSSPLYGHTPTTPTDIDATISLCLNAGVPAHKLGIGIGYYGIGYSGCTGPVQNFTSFLGDDATFNYNTILSDYLPSMTHGWDTTARVPYLWSNTPVGAKGATYISYDDAQSIAEKSVYIKTKGLGGMIAWHVAHQYLPSQPAGSRHPLLAATRDNLLR